jgi:hypothetical protein
VLEGAGVPCVIESADASAAALDIIGIRPLPFGDLYVPKDAPEKAIELLDEAWGTEWSAG